MQIRSTAVWVTSFLANSEFSAPLHMDEGFSSNNLGRTKMFRVPGRVRHVAICSHHFRQCGGYDKATGTNYSGTTCCHAGFYCKKAVMKVTGEQLGVSCE